VNGGKESNGNALGLGEGHKDTLQSHEKDKMPEYAMAAKHGSGSFLRDLGERFFI